MTVIIGAALLAMTFQAPCESLFLAPGVGHCDGGTFGSGNLADASNWSCAAP